MRHPTLVAGGADIQIANALRFKDVLPLDELEKRKALADDALQQIEGEAKLCEERLANPLAFPHELADAYDTAGKLVPHVASARRRAEAVAAAVKEAEAAKLPRKKTAKAHAENVKAFAAEARTTYDAMVLAIHELLRRGAELDRETIRLASSAHEVEVRSVWSIARGSDEAMPLARAGSVAPDVRLRLIDGGELPIPRAEAIDALPRRVRVTNIHRNRVGQGEPLPLPTNVPGTGAVIDADETVIVTIPDPSLADPLLGNPNFRIESA